MKNLFKSSAIAISLALLLPSCFAYTSVVGAGSQGKGEVTKWNHYVLYGLAPVGVSDSKALAGDATDYSVFTRQSFVNGLCAGLTFGIWTPTTTTVKK